MKIDQARRCDTPVLKLLPAMKTEDTFDKVVAQHRVIQATLFFNGQQWLGCCKRSSILTYAVT